MSRCPSRHAAKLIYLICDEKDRKATVSLRKYFRERALEVALPTFAGDAAAVRESTRSCWRPATP